MFHGWAHNIKQNTFNCIPQSYVISETVIMNVLRGDVARLQRCTAAVTGGNAEVSKQPNFLTNDHVATLSGRVNHIP